MIPRRLTNQQFRALLAARDGGGAFTSGARKQTVSLLIHRGWVDELVPHKITIAGLRAVSDAVGEHLSQSPDS